MRTNPERTVVVITIVAVCLLVTALLPLGAPSHAGLTRPGAEKCARRKATAEATAKLRASEAYGKLPLGFELNQGQTDARVKFLSRGAGYNLFLTSTEAVLSLAHSRGTGQERERGNRKSVSVRMMSCE